MKTSTDKTHYEVLGVNPGASTQQLRDAYIALAISRHPDKGGSKDEFAAITEAYSVLKDPTRRWAYDDVLRVLTAACPECGGSGVVYRIKNFTNRVESVCPSCAGRGIV